MKNQANTVSILIPTYNRCNFLGRAIESAINQTHQCEVIVCDHGSTDDTKKIVNQYVGKIKYIRLEKDYGVHFAEIHSLLEAEGEFIHFCFDDDWMDENYIEECLELMDEDTGIVFSEYKVVEINSKSTIDYKQKTTGEIKKKSCKSINFIYKVMTSLISPSCAIIRRKDAIRCMYMTTNLCSDKYYFGVGPDWLMTAYPLINYRKCGYVKNPLVYFGARDGSITVDAYCKNSIDKGNRLEDAYFGAKTYLVVSYITKILKIEKIIKLGTRIVTKMSRL